MTTLAFYKLPSFLLYSLFTFSITVFSPVRRRFFIFPLFQIAASFLTPFLLVLSEN
jgi:hypothetical protein